MARQRKVIWQAEDDASLASYYKQCSLRVVETQVGDNFGGAAIAPVGPLISILAPSNLSIATSKHAPSAPCAILHSWGASDESTKCPVRIRRCICHGGGGIHDVLE